MKFSEAMAALETGQKIRRTDMRGDYFYQLIDNKMHWVDERSNVAHEMVTISVANFNKYDWEIYQEPEDTEVYEWRYMSSVGNWFVSAQLMTINEAKEEFSNPEFYQQHEIHAGPFAVGKGER